MCGIIGVISPKEVTQTILGVLKRLEYRGYDSAGLATISNSKIQRRRSEGKIDQLVKLVEANPTSGKIGIGHTRWATHGVPNERNAHPHLSGTVVGVHNGIIENFRELRSDLEQNGYTFSSETDTEVSVKLCEYYLDKGLSFKDAFKRVISKLKGTFALCFMHQADGQKLFVARRGAPLAIGYGQNGTFVGSDALSISNLVDKITFLEDEDWGVIEEGKGRLFDKNELTVSRTLKSFEKKDSLIERGNYSHFMLKEINEQPEVLGYAVSSFVDENINQIDNFPNSEEANQIEKLILIGCGTAFYACLVAKYWFEEYSGIQVEADVASEYRYRQSSFRDNEYAIFVSQSGETADTLAALRKVRGNVKKIISIVNVQESSIARESDLVLPIKAGPEIGVASTKAFTCQLSVLAALSIHLGRAKGLLSQKKHQELFSGLISIPRIMLDILSQESEFREFALRIKAAVSTLFLARGNLYPLALEAALKLKEISYIHAEGYPSGELKHGPIALVDSEIPIICFAPSNNLFDKTISNVEEVMARKGKVLLITDKTGSDRSIGDKVPTIVVPKCIRFIQPIVYAIPAQLIAYHVAVLKGTNVDQPRNLAKSVTVE